MNTAHKPRARACGRAFARAAGLSAAALIAAVSAAAPAPAHAGDWVDTMMDWNPYVGSDLMRTSYNYDSGYEQNGVNIDAGKTIGETQYGLDVHGGFTPHENFGVEAGFFYNFGNEKTVSAGADIGDLIVAEDAKIKMSSWGLSLDALGYYAPLNNGNKHFKLIGTGGVTWTSVSYEGVINIGAGEGITPSGAKEFGFRFGGGMQFGMTENTNVRTLIRYQTAGLKGYAEGAWNYTIGVNYEF